MPRLHVEYRVVDDGLHAQHRLRLGGSEHHHCVAGCAVVDNYAIADSEGMEAGNLHAENVASTGA